MFAQVSFRVKCGSLQERMLRKFRVNLYRRTPPTGLPEGTVELSISLEYRLCFFNEYFDPYRLRQSISHRVAHALTTVPKKRRRFVQQSVCNRCFSSFSLEAVFLAGGVQVLEYCER